MFADWKTIYWCWFILIVSLTQSRTDSEESLIEDLCNSSYPAGISLVNKWPYLGLFKLGRCAHTERASMNTHSLTQVNTKKIEGWNLFHKPYVPSFQKDFLERVYSLLCVHLPRIIFMFQSVSLWIYWWLYTSFNMICHLQLYSVISPVREQVPGK